MMKISYFALITYFSGVICFSTPVTAIPTPVTSQLTNQATNNDNIRNLAQAITVKILVGNTQGSGVIIAKNGQIYTIITNTHVVNRSSSYRIQTIDGKIYPATLTNKGDSLGDNDLAILTFTSSNSYTVATMGNSANIQVNEPVYSAGYIIDLDQFIFNPSTIALITPKPLKGGYQISYHHETAGGMSGGPLLNSEGKLIGILGLGKGAVLDEAYTYLDNSNPTPETLEQWRELSFAVPIANIQQIAPYLAVLLPKSESVATNNSSPTQYTGIVKEVDDMAAQITVRIDSKYSGNASGVIVAKEGNNYYVLTAGHVVDRDQSESNPSCEFITNNGEKEAYTIVTPDQKKYRVKLAEITCFEGVDLAVLKFNSNQTYRVATLSNLKYSFLGLGEFVFVSGFPGRNPSQRLLTGGRVSEQSFSEWVTKDPFSFTKGNQLLYTNPSQKGMSGGPVLDRKGRVIGINTGAENEIEIDQNGEIFELSLGGSLGIPISTFISFANQAKIKQSQLNIEETSLSEISPTEFNQLKEQFFSLQTPATNADAFTWFNFAHQLLYAEKYQEALATIDQAIKIKPDFYQAYYYKGIIFSNQKKYQEALLQFEQAISINPSFYQAWKWKAMTLSSLGKMSESIAAYQQAIKLNDRDVFLYTMYGMSLAALNQDQEAIAALTQANKIKSSYFTYSILGLLYWKKQDHKTALTNLNKAVEIAPDHAFSYLFRGLFYQQLKVYNQALDDYSKAVEIMPILSSIRGDLYAELNNHSQAIADYNKSIEIFSELIKITPNNPDPYNSRANLYKNIKEYEKAIADYTQAIKINPNYTDAYFNRGDVYFDQQKWDLAIADYTQAIKINPNYTDAYFNRGNAYLNQKKWDLAIADYTQAITINPNYAIAYFNRGLVYSNQKKWDLAIADYTQVIKINPNYALTYFNRGNAYLNQQKLDLAIVDYTQVITIDPNYIDAYINRGIAYYQQQKLDLALSDYNQAITIKPNYTLAYILRANAHHKNKQWDLALNDYNQVVNLEQENVNAIINIGLIKYERGSIKEAREQFEQAIKINQQLAEPKLALAVVLYQQGEREKAKQLAKYALSLEPNFSDPDFLQENLWGDNIIDDTQQLLALLQH